MAWMGALCALVTLLHLRAPYAAAAEARTECHVPEQVQHTQPFPREVFPSKGGTSLRYQCEAGYRRKAGTSNLIVCKADEGGGTARWTTPEVECIRQRADLPPSQGGQGSQSQAQQDPDPTGSAVPQRTVDDPNQPGSSGSQTPAATVPATSLPTTGPIPTTSQQTGQSPAHDSQESQSENEGHPLSGAPEVGDNLHPPSTRGARRSGVPTSAGRARVGQGGGSGARRRRESGQPAAGPCMPELTNIFEAYQRDTREVSQLAEALNQVREQQAEQIARQDLHYGRVEAHQAQLLMVHRDILHVLRQMAANMQPPPCVTRPATSRQSATPATGREEEEEEPSDVASHAPSMPAHEGPPRKVGRPRRRR
ncbi:interleukin-15 receptor subunit alpha isoform X1 [Lissotriton helveticus]